MKYTKTVVSGIGLAILIIGISCNLLSGPTSTPVPPTPITMAVETSLPAPSPKADTKEEVVIETDFPLPEDVQNFSNLGTGEDAINFQTKMTVEEAVAFYREAFTKKGLSEDKLLATVEATTFSIVFRGDPNGKAVVVQGVDLGSGVININVRYEET